MKKVLTAMIIATTILSCASTKNMQHKADYETIQDTDTKILKGYINRSIIENDGSFTWFKEHMYPGATDANGIAAFGANKNKFSMLVFGGTWCGDTKNLLPIFYNLVDKSGYDDKKITLVGVDRNKKAKDDITTRYNITNVPTFIVLQNGKEVGRIVEYGKYNAIDKELGEIVSSLK